MCSDYFLNLLSLGGFPIIQYLKNKYEYLIYIYTFFWINLNFYNFIIIEEINKKLKFLENYFLINIFTKNKFKNLN